MEGYDTLKKLKQFLSPRYFGFLGLVLILIIFTTACKDKELTEKSNGSSTNIANFNPIVKIVKNNAVPSEDIFNIQPGEVLSTSELWAYVGRNVFVEQKDGTNTPALLTVNKVYHYLKNEVIIINSVVVSCPSFVATIEFDKDENSLIQDVLFSNFQKIGKHLLTIRKPKL